MGFLDRAREQIGDSGINMSGIREGLTRKVSSVRNSDSSDSGPSAKSDGSKSPGQKSAQESRQPATTSTEDDVDTDFPDDRFDDSAFSLTDDSDFFSRQDKENDQEKKHYEKIPDLKVVNNRVQDVLDVMGVSPTFSIPTDVFMPDDLGNVSFDMQAPVGYESGQVISFVEKTRITVQHYVDLLQKRNEDVAKLASMVDKLQVNMNNLRYSNEIAQGVNVVPTDDSEDVQGQLLETRLKVKRLEDELRSKEQSQVFSNKEREHYAEVQDELSVARREIEMLRDQNAALREEIVELEEGVENMQQPGPDVPEPKKASPPPVSSSKPSRGLPVMGRGPSNQSLPAVGPGASLRLPTVTDSPLPHVVSDYESTHETAPPHSQGTNKAFYIDEEDSEDMYEQDTVFVPSDEAEITMLEEDADDDDAEFERSVQEWMDR